MTHKEKSEEFIVPENPYDLFGEWLALAEKSEINDPGAMCLATSTPDGKVSARMVLLKEVNEQGFKFHTNEQSLKGTQLSKNPHAALCFHWKSLRKQIRIEGFIEPATQEESEEYFRTRSRESQIGAWASQQSRPLENYEALEERYNHYKEKFEQEDHIPKPDYWVGYRLVPAQFEFWQDGAHRLHQRYLYTQDDNGNWTTGMLYP